MKVLFLTLYPETMGSSRLRVYQYLPYLHRFGIEATVLPAVPEPWFSRFYNSPSKAIRLIHCAAETLGSLGRLLQGRNYDVVFVQKGILSANWKGFDRLLGWVNRRLIFDLDDLVYGQNTIDFRSRLLAAFQDKNQTEKISSLARAVIVGNSFLRDLALRHNRNVFVIPTPVDTNRFVPRKATFRRERGEMVIGWIGDKGGLTYVRLLEGVFRELSKRYPVRLKLISRFGREPFYWQGLRVDCVEWSYQNEVREMEDFDIGVMPLPNNDWARGKCSLKLLQYMAMGLPSVSSRVGNNTEIIEEGRDGFLAHEPEEWIKKLARLIEDPSYGKSMGEAARKKAVENYSLEKTVPLLAQVLHGNRI